MRTLSGILLALLIVLAGCAQAPGTDSTGTPVVVEGADDTEIPGATETSSGDELQTGEANQLPDPETDVLGWENGYWYNETFVVDQRDGLNETELDMVIARAMARVEHIRGLEFEKTVPVSIQTRDEFKAEQENRSISEQRRLFDNVKFEALFMINESADSIGIQNTNSGTAIGGYYSPSEERIVVVSENTTSPKLNEITLSQELFHALQDQRFNISAFNQSTRELHNAKDGIIEGDGNYVDYLYEQRCNDEWQGQCLMPLPSDGGGSGGGLANYGTYILKFQPYSDGPPFVKRLHEQQGWEAVNDVYVNQPASTEQIIHPEKYPDDVPTELTIDDRSTDRWNRLKMDERVNYGELGEAGLFSMFMYPAYATGGRTQVIPANGFFNYDDEGNLDEIDPLNYDHPYSDGWDGDKFAVYTTDDGKTGYVWQLAWDAERDVSEFVEGYQKLLEFRKATPVDGRKNTWMIAEEDDYSGAYYVHTDGKTVTIVRAPSVEELAGIWAGAAPNE